MTWFFAVSLIDFPTEGKWFCLVCPVCMIVDNEDHFIRPLKIGASESNAICAELVSMITGEAKTVFLESDTENKSASLFNWK